MWLSEACRSGDGSSYRGTVSRSAFGKKCLNWKNYYNRWGASEGIGNHNYCRYALGHCCRSQICVRRSVWCLILFPLNARNPDHNLMPWCFVRRGKKTVRQFCNIPRCKAEIWDLRVIKILYVCLSFFFFAKLLFLLPLRLWTNRKAFTCCGYRYYCCLNALFLIVWLPWSALTDSSCVTLQSWHVVRCPSRGWIKSWVVLSHL